MKLRHITFLGIAALTLLFLGIESWVASSVVKDGFNALERQFAAADARRVKNEVLREIEALDTFLWDWSSWDDTYDFAATGSAEYIESNLPTETFTSQSLNAVIITDTRGRMVFGRALDADGEDDPALLATLAEATMDRADLSPASGNAEEAGVGGFMVMSNGIMLFARRDVLDSRDSGPPAGRMLMARLLNEETRQAIAGRLELSVEFHPLAPDREASEPDKATLDALISANGLLVRPRNGDIIDAHALLPDLDGRPGLVVSVARPRSISSQGRSVANLNFMVLAAALVTFGLLVFYLMRRKVISRVESLNAEVKTLGRSDKRHVTIRGRDEIAELGMAINAMLDQIETNRKALQTAHDDLEIKVGERTAELEEANRELVWLDKAKSHFLSSTSHELRTPLTSILGFVKLMERTFRESFGPSLEECDEPPERIAKHLQNYRIVRTEAERLSRLIDDLLDFSKITAGKMDWHESDVRAEDLVRDAVAAIEGQLAEKPQLELACRVPSDLPVLRVSKDRIHQVLINLLGNAVKHTDSGFIRVTARAVDKAVEFSVEDTGSGIPPEDREHIFEVFYQARSKAPSPRPVGTGLGLAISKEIVEHYGGTIRVDSEPGRGSTFTFSLPTSPAAGM
jgi:signal transduction histidine kinase